MALKEVVKMEILFSGVFVRVEDLVDEKILWGVVVPNHSSKDFDFNIVYENGGFDRLCSYRENLNGEYGFNSKGELLTKSELNEPPRRITHIYDVDSFNWAKYAYKHNFVPYWNR